MNIPIARYHKRIIEIYPIQRMRVFDQSNNETIAFSLSGLDAWDYARRANRGRNDQWASEWVLLNKDGSYEKTKYDEDYVHNNSIIKEL